MIDLHCHMLPGIDDGAPDLETALQMARTAVDDGVTLTACTPHIYPGMFENTVGGIRAALTAFRGDLQNAGIPLEITMGADIQIVPDLVEGLQEGRLPTLHGSRYFLFEPPHHVEPPGMLDLVHNVLNCGYVPVITHPERLTYVEAGYDQFTRAVEMGAWLQITGGSLCGRFGRRAQKVSERFLRDGLVHLLASDGHNLGNRAPVLGEGRQAAASLVGHEEASRLVEGRPRLVIENRDPGELPVSIAPSASRGRGWFRSLFR